MSRVTTDDIYALMDALRARKGYVSVQDIHTLIERRGGPIIPELPGHTVVEMKRLPKGTNTKTDCGQDLSAHTIDWLRVDPSGNLGWLTREAGKLVLRNGSSRFELPLEYSRSMIKPLDFVIDESGSWMPRWVLYIYHPGTSRPIKEVFIGDRKCDEPDNLVGFYPQPDGKVVRVHKMPNDSGIGYRIMLDADVLHDSHPAVRECKNFVQAPDGTWYALHGSYLKECFTARPLVEDSDKDTDIAAVDLVVHNDTLYLIADHTKSRDNTTQPEFRAAVHKRLGTGVTGIALTKIPYKRWFTPDVAQGGYEEEPTYLGETYVGQVGDGNARFETWIAQNFYPDTPKLLVGPNWDHVSQTFQDPEHGLCYWAVAGMYLFKVAFNPYG